MAVIAGERLFGKKWLGPVTFGYYWGPQSPRRGKQVWMLEEQDERTGALPD